MQGVWCSSRGPTPTHEDIKLGREELGRVDDMHNNRVSEGEVWSRGELEPDSTGGDGVSTWHEQSLGLTLSPLHQPVQQGR